jgi:hypothetical protein
LKNKLFDYINDRFDNDGVLVDADEVYEAFQIEFDNGQSVELIDHVMLGFISTHNLANIRINWEGELA